jgi:general secretion pathway protein D
VQPFEQEVQVTRYDQTNALLIVASPQDYKILESLIARLDVPQRQVHVDAVVMDVTTSNDYGVTVEAADITGNDGFGVTGTSNLIDLAGALAPVSDAANAIVSPGAALAGAVLGLGQAGGLTAGVYDDLEVEVNGVDVKIPFVPLLFQAIEQVTDVEVLSQPSLVTVDNEEARIIVGQEVPFVTSQGRTSFDESGNPVSLGFTGGFNQIQREDVGVQLQVTPQISEGDNVLLEIEIEISDTDAQQIGTVDLLGPTTNKTQITNKVLVKDGSTAVLAGLIRDNAVRDRTQSPVLGDLPVLGVLFRNRSNRHEKRNLVVLVTPSIIKEHTDLKRVTQYKVDEYHDTNIDQLFNAGFFKKVKKKAEQRKEHRPTFDRSEALTGRRSESSIGFSRGDIER